MGNDASGTTSAERERDSEGEGEDAHVHERLFWRRLAYWGATRGPEWWVRYSPPVFGWAAAALVPSARRAVRHNLHRIRGPASRLRDARDVLATFSTYASCLAEVLSNDAPEGPRMPRAIMHGEEWIREALRARRGVVVTTAHTAGWETVGPLFAREFGPEIMLVMQAEPDSRAGRLQDQARLRAGVRIARIGDPLASLPLLRHLRDGGVVALQIDRVAPGMRTRTVDLLGREAQIPEGPLRLAQLSGAHVVPVFCARRRYREYEIAVFEPRMLDRRAKEAAIDEAAQHIATSMTRFLREHPTQWFQFTAD